MNLKVYTTCSFILCKQNRLGLLEKLLDSVTHNLNRLATLLNKIIYEFGHNFSMFETRSHCNKAWSY